MDNPTMQVVPGSCPPPSLAKGSGTPESIPLRPTESGILLCRPTLGLLRGLPVPACPTPWSTDVLWSDPLAVLWLGYHETLGASHSTGLKTQPLKAGGNKGTHVLWLLSTKGIRAGKQPFLPTVKGTLFSKGWR